MAEPQENEAVGHATPARSSNPVVKRFDPIFLWPLLCLLFVILIWCVTFFKIQSTEAIAKKNAFAHATSLSTAYAEQLARTVQGIEALTLNVKYQWEHTSTGVDLEDQFKKGLYPPTSQLTVTLLNKDGTTFASTLQSPMLDSSDRDYFKFHKANTYDGLHINPAVSLGRQSKRPVIRFTRRLNTKSGAFDGVVLVSVEPDYLATFNDQKSLNPNDFISIRHDSGILLVSEKGVSRGEVHISPPVFPTESGVQRSPKENYKDGDARILAWKKLADYPLVSYVGLSEKNIYADQEGTLSSYRYIALIATCLLAFFAMLGMYFSSRLAIKKRQADEIKKTYLLAVDHAREGFYTMRPLLTTAKEICDFIIEDCNERGATFVGHTKISLVGLHLSSIALGEDKGMTLAIFRRAMESGFHEDEVSLNETSGQPTWLQRRLVRSESGLAVTIRDISKSKEQEQLLITTANTDALTSLPNRFWFLNYLPILLRDAQTTRSKFALLFIDLDNFKGVNDSLGHEMGDQLLCHAAQRLKSLVRAQDTVVRLGGDEFTVLLDSFEHSDEVAIIASRIAASFSQDFNILGRIINVGASIGISSYPDDGMEPDILVQKADIAMYAAKADGKMTYRFYNQHLHDRIKAELDAEDELRRAVSLNQFEIHYQPRVAIKNRELKGLEALVRWRHPERGLISPVDFIPLAEKTRSIVPLGAIVLEQVCKQITSWREEGERLVPISVNISPLQLDAGGIDQLLLSMLTRYNITSAEIEVELTETSMMNETQEVVDQIAAIRAMGVRIHIDDFGTGYSSLARLQEIKTQVLKVDRAFTSKLGLSKESDILFKAIVEMGKALGMKVIAEGVETEAQLAILEYLECDEIQGFLISKPLPPADIPPLLRQRFLSFS